MSRFSVTWEIVTDESATHGDVARYGVAAIDQTLRDALKHARRTLPRDAGIECIQPNDSVLNQARWITYVCGRGRYDGEFKSVSIHFPGNLSPSSRARVARFLGVR